MGDCFSYWIFIDLIVTCLLVFFLAVGGAITSYKKANLMFLQELAFGSELSIKYHLSRMIRYVCSFITIGMLFNIVVSEIMKSFIHYRLSANAVFPTNLFLAHN